MDACVAHVRPCSGGCAALGDLEVGSHSAQQCKQPVLSSHRIDLHTMSGQSGPDS